MKRLFSFIVLMILFTGMAFAQGFDLNVFVSAVYDVNSTNGFEEILIKARNGIGFAYDHEIMPFLSPGVEAQIGFCPFASMFKEKVILFDYSARIYNGMRLAGLELQPYLGYNFRTARADGSAYQSGTTELGIRSIFSTYGLEFAWVFPGNEIIIPAYGQFPNDVEVVLSKPSIKMAISWHLRRRR